MKLYVLTHTSEEELYGNKSGVFSTIEKAKEWAYEVESEAQGRNIKSDWNKAGKIHIWHCGDYSYYEIFTIQLDNGGFY